jgi:ligand-binding SRPBCC domain-containing protein
MKLYEFRRELRLPISPDTAWDFFSNPNNLTLITPPSLNLRPVGPVPDRMHEGMIVAYEVRPLFGIRHTWVTEITHVDRPNRFVDEQRFGPYKFWHHTHEFWPEPEGIRAVDLVRYALKLDPFSRLALPFVQAQLESIFSFRNNALIARFGTPPG